MQEIIKSYLLKKLDEGNLKLVFKYDKDGKITGFTELGNQVVHTTTALAVAESNDTVITTAEGHTNDACDYQTFGGNMGTCVNFSDRVAMAATAKLARRWAVKSNCSLEYSKEYVVSPAVHADNLELLKSKFKKSESAFSLTKVDKSTTLLHSLGYVYKSETEFYDVATETAATGNKNVVYLRKVKFTNDALSKLFVTEVNYHDEQEFINWLAKESK